MRVFALLAILAAPTAPVWGADVEVAGEPYAPPYAVAHETDAQLELAHDTGTRRWSLAWYTGAGAYVGNYFNLSSISTYAAVEKVKFYTRADWPNNRWDGFRVAIYSYGGGGPGVKIWPTGSGWYFFKPSGLSGHVWVEIPIGWTCPEVLFMPVIEQVYNYPNCDPFAVDTNPTYRYTSWQFLGGWEPLEGYGGYRNLMLRAVVDNSTLDVAPCSLGRVKALYF